jgi:NAD(P)-dependent dehydrogenase (short-subunit alcohol dehydrogenase family)
MTSSTRATGRGVLVTGGARGIGGAVSRAFVENGDIVVVVDSVGPAGMALRPGEAERLRVVQGDVRDEKVLARAVGEVEELAGQLDVAVNNAGVAGPHRLLVDFTAEEYELIMGVNVRGVFNAMRHEIIAMQRQDAGVIVNMASAIGLVGAANQSVYSASKHAVVGLTRSAALDYGGTGLRINCVCPGVIESDLSRAAQAENPGLGEVWSGLHPIGRLGQPEEVAAAVLWLADPASSFITGAAISVDGGYTTR